MHAFLQTYGRYEPDPTCRPPGCCPNPTPNPAEASPSPTRGWGAVQHGGCSEAADVGPNVYGNSATDRGTISDLETSKWASSTGISKAELEEAREIWSALFLENEKSPPVEAQRVWYGACAGDQVGFYLRCQGELLGLWDPQNRDLRRKLPPETNFSVG